MIATSMDGFLVGVMVGLVLGGVGGIVAIALVTVGAGRSRRKGNPALPTPPAPTGTLSASERAVPGI